MQYEKLDIVNLTVIVMLGAALIMTIIYGLDQLATIIASGLIGYIGGTVRTNIKDRGDNLK